MSAAAAVVNLASSEIVDSLAVLQRTIRRTADNTICGDARDSALSACLVAQAALSAPNRLVMRLLSDVEELLRSALTADSAAQYAREHIWKAHLEEVGRIIRLYLAERSASTTAVAA